MTEASLGTPRDIHKASRGVPTSMPTPTYRLGGLGDPGCAGVLVSGVLAVADSPEAELAGESGANGSLLLWSGLG